MHHEHLSPGKRIIVTHYGPFRGLRGSFVQVYTMNDKEEEPLCFYLIALDTQREPIWFELAEIEALEAGRRTASRLVVSEVKTPSSNKQKGHLNE